MGAEATKEPKQSRFLEIPFAKQEFIENLGQNLQRGGDVFVIVTQSIEVLSYN